MKKIGCLLAVFCLVLGFLPPVSAETEDVIIIETVTFGAEYTDIPIVEEAVNKIVFPLLNAKIKLLNVDIRRHESQINKMIANGEQIDLVMAGLTLPMTQMVLEGKLLPLDDLVAAQGAHLLSFLGGQMDAGRVNGALYAIPADAYTAKSGGFIYNREMADSLGIQVPNPVSCDQLEQIFSVLHEKLPGVYGTVFGNGETFNPQYDICLEGYGNTLFAYGVTFDPFKSTKIENLFESPAFRDYLHRHRDWVEKGYAPDHSLTSGIRSNEYIAHRQVFGTANLDDIAIRFHRLAARLVAVHWHAAFGVDAGDLHKIVVRDFDENHVDVPHGQRLRLVDNLQSVKRQRIGAVGRRRPCAVVRDGDDLKVVLHIRQGEQLPGRMLVLQPVEQCPQRTFWFAIHLLCPS